MSLTEKGRWHNGRVTDRGRVVVGSITETGVRAFAIIVPPVVAGPVVTIVSVDKNKISDEPGMDRANVVFKFDVDVIEWTINVLGVSWNTGTIAASGLAVAANMGITGEIDYLELYAEGINRVNIYGKGANGTWTAYGS